MLIAAPTASAKNYCFEKWIENVLDFTYPDFDVVLFDNSIEGRTNADHLTDLFISRYGLSDKFKAFYSERSRGKESVIERMAISHNDCRDYFLKGKYGYMLHLESDVMPEKNVIEELLIHRKPVISALYYRDEGQYRKLCITHRKPMPHNMTPGEDVVFVDGTIKKVASAGLGCTLIHQSVLEKISFRFDPNISVHPDSFFYDDCFKHGIEVWADTSQIAQHDNQPWGRPGIDF